MDPSNPYVLLLLAENSPCYGYHDADDAACQGCILAEACQRYTTYKPSQHQQQRMAIEPLDNILDKVESNLAKKVPVLQAVTAGKCCVCNQAYRVGDKVIFVPNKGPKHITC